MTTVTLSCKHSADVADPVALGDKIACSKCPANKSGLPRRTVKSIRRPVADVEPADEAIAVAVDEAIDQAPVVSRAAAQLDRLERARDAAKNGGDAAAVLAEPLPEQPAKARKSRKDANGRVTFFHLSANRTAALRAAGFEVPDEATTVDVHRPDVAALLAALPKVCDDESQTQGVRTAACKAVAWLERFRDQV
jgi:hypothetical protein